MTPTPRRRPVHFARLAAVAALALGLAAGVQGLRAAPTYEHFLVGNPADALRAPRGGLLLMGGGTDVDAAFTWLIGQADGGDVLVLRASGTDAYNPYILGLGPADSVETIVLKNRRASAEAFVLGRVGAAEAIFFAGGDQADYVDRIKGTLLEDAVHAAVARGVPIGGTSAGLAILGDFLFSATRGTVTSPDALADPYARRVALDRDFLVMPQLGNVITDSHFVERDRMGRFVAFLARLAADGWTPAARGIAIDSQTAVLVDAGGSAAIVSNPGHATPFAYFAAGPGVPEVAMPKTPLTYTGVGVYRLAPGGTFDLERWRGTGGVSYAVSATSGVLSSTQAGGSIY